jgi:hypothetical protein
MTEPRVLSPRWNTELFSLFRHDWNGPRYGPSTPLLHQKRVSVSSDILLHEYLIQWSSISKILSRTEIGLSLEL